MRLIYNILYIIFGNKTYLPNRSATHMLVICVHSHLHPQMNIAIYSGSTIFFLLTPTFPEISLYPKGILNMIIHIFAGFVNYKCRFSGIRGKKNADFYNFMSFYPKARKRLSYRSNYRFPALCTHLNSLSQQKINYHFLLVICQEVHVTAPF